MPKKNNKMQKAWGQVSTAEAGVKAMSELLGTGLLVLVACMGCLPGWATGAPPPVQYSLSVGLVVMFVVQICAHISGAHINPAVTLASLIFGSISLPMACVYVLAQFVGAVLGYGLLVVITPEVALGGEKAFCVTMPNAALSSLQAVIVEAIITGILVLLCCSLWDKRNSHNTDGIPLKFGFTVATLAMSAGSFTGASMNPARSFGPVLFTGQWTSHWVYWVGPFLGASICSLLYCYVFRSEPPTPSPREEEPLTEIRDKPTTAEV